MEDIGRDEVGSVQLNEVIIGQIPPFAMLGWSPREDLLALAPPLLIADPSTPVEAFPAFANAQRDGRRFGRIVMRLVFQFSSPELLWKYVPFLILSGFLKPVYG